MSPSPRAADSHALPRSRRNPIRHSLERLPAFNLPTMRSAAPGNPAAGGSLPRAFSAASSGRSPVGHHMRFQVGQAHVVQRAGRVHHCLATSTCAGKRTGGKGGTTTPGKYGANAGGGRCRAVISGIAAVGVRTWFMVYRSTASTEACNAGRRLAGASGRSADASSRMLPLAALMLSSWTPARGLPLKNMLNVCVRKVRPFHEGVVDSGRSPLRPRHASSVACRARPRCPAGAESCRLPVVAGRAENSGGCISDSIPPPSNSCVPSTRLPQFLISSWQSTSSFFTRKTPSLGRRT